MDWWLVVGTGSAVALYVLVLIRLYQVSKEYAESLVRK